MEKSFDIRAPEDSHLISYFDKLPNYSNFKVNVNKNRAKSILSRRTTVTQPKHPKNSKKISEAYNNNTILNQVSLPSGYGAKAVNETNDLYQAIVKYKAITGMIEKHLTHEGNVFRQLINLFISYFSHTYGRVLENLKKGKLSLDNFNVYTIKSTLDLQQFIRILYESVSLFYRLKNLKVGKLPDGDTLFNRDNMLNFVTAIVFDEKMYNLIFELYQQQDSKLERTYQKNIKLCKNLRPQDFGVPDAYCLNERTVQYLKAKGLIQDSIIPAEDQAGSGILDDKMTISGNTKHKEVVLHLNSPAIKEPYEKAIQILGTLKLQKSPIHKLKIILKVIELISVAIETFYRDHGVGNTKKLDADQTLSICLYVVARSDVENITTHCKLIERFSTTNILNSVSGYYATTLEACMNCLCSMEFDQEVSEAEISVHLKQQIQAFDVIGQ
jgi:hypothetical protein